MGLGNASFETMKCGAIGWCISIEKKNRNGKGAGSWKLGNTATPWRWEAGERSLRLFGIQNVSLWLLRFCRLGHWLPEYRFDYIMHYTHHKCRICKSARWRGITVPLSCATGIQHTPDVSVLCTRQNEQTRLSESPSALGTTKPMNRFDFNVTAVFAEVANFILITALIQQS